MVGHPDAHRGVFLSKELSACNGVAILVPNPFTQPELDDAEQQGRDAEPDDTGPIALAVEEDEMYGLSQSQEQGCSPEIESQAFVSADVTVGFGPQELQGQGHEERQADDGSDASQNMQK